MGDAAVPPVPLESPHPLRQLSELKRRRKDLLEELSLLDAQIQEVEPKARKHMFRSALDNECLTSLILQFAMYDHEARGALAADPALGLEYLYHKKRFVLRGLGVEVKDAEDA